MGSSQPLSEFTGLNLGTRRASLIFSLYLSRQTWCYLLLLIGSSLLAIVLAQAEGAAQAIVGEKRAIAPGQSPSGPSLSIQKADFPVAPEPQTTVAVERTTGHPAAAVPDSLTSDLLSAIDSRKAADLLQPPSQTTLTAENLIEQAATTNPIQPTWSIAETVVPPLKANETKATEQLVGRPEPSRSPNLDLTPVTPAPVTVAADPGNPTPLPPVQEQECANFDPELGCLRLQEPVFAAGSAKSPILYLVPRLDFFRSNNVLLGIDPIEDGLIRPSLTLLAIPQIGPNTFVVASVEGGFSRYFKLPEFNYDELRIRAGILQRLSPVMWGEFGWTNQQLFISGNELEGFPSGTRFLNDHAIRLELSRRDQLAKRLSLSSIYQLRIGFSDPTERSRILNVLYLSLNYELTPNLQAGLDYQFVATNFTVIPRTDLYHQILGRITFNAFRNTQLSVYGGLSLGSSTEPGIDFNSYILGVNMSVNLPLF